MFGTASTVTLWTPRALGPTGRATGAAVTMPDSPSDRLSCQQGQQMKTGVTTATGQATQAKCPSPSRKKTTCWGKAAVVCAKRFSVLACVLLFSQLTACESPIRAERMVPTDFDVESRHPYSVSVMTQGGKGTTAQRAEINDDAFREAIERSIMASAVFSTVVEGDADYELSVIILEATRPPAVLGSFSATVTVLTQWILSRPSGTVFETFVETEHSSSAFSGGKRWRLAKEGAARKNVREGIRRLSRFEL